jgi:hypothetical protein
MWTERQTDRHAKANSHFVNFASAPKNWTLICKCQRGNKMNQWVEFCYCTEHVGIAGQFCYCTEHVGIAGQFSWMLKYASKRRYDLGLSWICILPFILTLQMVINRLNYFLVIAKRVRSLMFCWLCIVVYQYSKTNEMQFLYSIYYELTASTCFEHYLLTFRRCCTNNNWYIACVLCRLAGVLVAASRPNTHAIYQLLFV